MYLQLRDVGQSFFTPLQRPEAELAPVFLSVQAGMTLSCGRRALACVCVGREVSVGR